MEKKEVAVIISNEEDIEATLIEKKEELYKTPVFLPIKIHIKNINNGKEYCSEVLYFIKDNKIDSIFIPKINDIKNNFGKLYFINDGFFVDSIPLIKLNKIKKYFEYNLLCIELFNNDTFYNLLENNKKFKDNFIKIFLNKKWVAVINNCLENNKIKDNLIEQLVEITKGEENEG